MNDKFELAPVTPSPGCVTLWDNRNTMHYAVNDYDGYRRCLYRTTIRGEAPLPA